MAIRGLWQFGKSQIQRLIRDDLKIWGLLLTPFILWAVIDVPRWQASRVTLKDPKKYFEAENKARSTLLQAVGGAFFFVTAYVGLKQLRVAEDNRKLTEHKNSTDRFVKAAEMLADRDRMEVRLAGIYALGRIVRDSPEDHWTVMQLLLSFIEDRTDESTIFAKDVPAALNVIGKRNVGNDPKFVTGTEHQSVARLEFHIANLHFSKLFLLNFDRARLEFVDLSLALLRGVSFKGASFSNCSFSEAWLLAGEVTWAIFEQCNLSGSKFDATQVKSVRFIGCNLTNAVFRCSDLSETYFFNGCDLSGTDFRLAEGLTEPKQIEQADHWKKAIYSPEFASKLPLTDEEREEMARIRQKTALRIQLKQEDYNDLISERGT